MAESVSTHIPNLDIASGLNVYSYYVTDRGKDTRNHPLPRSSKNVFALCSPGLARSFLGKETLVTLFLLPVFSL